MGGTITHWEQQNIFCNVRVVYLFTSAFSLHAALKPLVGNKDGHFVAAVTSQSLLEGRTDCPISGVFGAGKTLSAAAMIAGLLVMDPTLKVMIVTKENVAAHAFAKHFLRLGYRTPSTL